MSRFGKIHSEVKIGTARSSGPGGQHVNKVSTKVILSFNVWESPALTEYEKRLISKKLASKLTKDGQLIVSSDDQRSQLRNKETAFKKLDRLLANALKTKKRRIATKPSKASIDKRIKAKKLKSEKKKWRQKL